MRILCFNAGSSAIRLAAFEARENDLHEVLPAREVTDAGWRDALGDFTPDAVAHRIVRGVKTSIPAEIFTDAVNAEILHTEDLAPTHDPHALMLLSSSQAAFPRASQFVVYDTAFHATIPPEHATYAIPRAWRERGIRRVGYHGLSCAFTAQWLEQHAGNPVRAIHAHLGNGCSVTALHNGKSIATTMGFTPLEGLVMGTRSGSIDPGILLHLEHDGMPAAELRSALFRESGLRALCGTNDMRIIQERRGHGDADAALAFDVFVASASAAIAQMAAALGGVDALTFGGGIGLHSNAARDAIRERLAWMLHGVPVYTLDVQEERMMALAVSSARILS